MWIVTVTDSELQCDHDILVYTNEDFQQLFDFIKMSPNLGLYRMEERDVCPTVELFIEEMKSEGSK